MIYRRYGEIHLQLRMPAQGFAYPQNDVFGKGK